MISLKFVIPIMLVESLFSAKVIYILIKQDSMWQKPTRQRLKEIQSKVSWKLSLEFNNTQGIEFCQ